MENKNKLIFFSAIVIAIIGFLFFYTKDFNPTSSPTYKTPVSEKVNEKEPTTPLYIITKDWVTYDSGPMSGGLTIKYPKDLNLAYIHPVDWPPKLNLEIGVPFSCIEAGVETERAGRTEFITVKGGQVYCLTRVSGSATGSSYTQYSYSRAFGSETLIMNFSLQFPNCYNYPEEQQPECLSEQATFNVNELVHQMFSTVTPA